MDTRIRLVAVLMIILGGVVPPVMYWLFIARVPTVTPEEAKEILAQPGSGAVLVDVRTPEEFAANHLDAAQNWPYEKILALTCAKDTPNQLQGKRLLLICESGILSGLAARKFQELGIHEVANVQGGMQTWVASAENPCTLGLCRLRAATGQTSGLPFRESPRLEQWAAVITGFVVKPLYTTLSFALVVVLWRRRSPDLAALRWALVFFFIGENFCAANYLVYNDRSELFEYLHSYGMVLCFGLTTFALLEGFDRRLIKFSDADARCAAISLCHRCVKHTDASCGLKRVFMFLIPAAAILTFIPLTAELVSVSYNTRILGTFYNYSHPVVYQILEFRYLPVAALALLAVSLLVLLCKSNEPVLWSKVLFAAGIGALGFSFFRLVFFYAYRDNLVWFGVWEEVTELLFMLGASLVLWSFRPGLFGEESFARATKRPQS